MQAQPVFDTPSEVQLKVEKHSGSSMRLSMHLGCVLLQGADYIRALPECMLPVG